MLMDMFSDFLTKDNGHHRTESRAVNHNKVLPIFSDLSVQTKQISETWSVQNIYVFLNISSIFYGIVLVAYFPDKPFRRYLGLELLLQDNAVLLFNNQYHDTKL